MDTKDVDTRRKVDSDMHLLVAGLADLPFRSRAHYDLSLLAPQLAPLK